MSFNASAFVAVVLRVTDSETRLDSRDLATLDLLLEVRPSEHDLLAVQRLIGSLRIHPAEWHQRLRLALRLRARWLAVGDVGPAPSLSAPWNTLVGIFDTSVPR